MNTLPVPIGGASIAAALESAHAYARSDTADATRRAYGSDCTDFAAWCGTHHREALPASVDTTAAYLASLADRGLKASTISRRAAAIAYAHRQAGLEPPTSSGPVKRVLKGIRRETGVAVERKAPATAIAIKGMLRRIPDTLIGKRDRALLLLGFAAALRRSELVALQVEHIERAPEGIRVTIARSKTDQEGEGHVVAVPRGSKLRPVEALDDWLAAAGVDAGPLFRQIRRGGHLSLAPLSGAAVAEIVKQRAAAAGLDPNLFSGHSLRAGFVTSALEGGADILKVMDVTRHREVGTLKGYDRRAQAFRNHAGRSFL